ncbi:MAG: CinA family protein [Actinomycetota bacterium]|nr:CinA family protein [Actinomycetota bacterium]
MNGQEDLIALLRDMGASVSTAESLTGGLVCAALVAVPGASDVVRGSIVAYTSDAKTDVLGVPADLIVRYGAVDERVASSMANATRRRFDSTYGLATTGVAGPEPSEGKPAGTVHIAIAGPQGTESWLLDLAGNRDTIRNSTVSELLSRFVDRVREESRS